jgi:hypothetical protein
MKQEFTQEQMSWYQVYEAVRSGGAYNMFDPRALESTGLAKNEYLFVLNNFSAMTTAMEVSHEQP